MDAEPDAPPLGADSSSCLSWEEDLEPSYEPLCAKTGRFNEYGPLTIFKFRP
jgi:hypothetical protein